MRKHQTLFVTKVVKKIPKPLATSLLTGLPQIIDNHENNSRMNFALIAENLSWIGIMYKLRAG